MALKVADAGSSQRRFVERGQAAARDYTEGVRAAGDDWARETAASADNWAAGVQNAIGRGAFGKGVSEAGPSKYVTKASTLGANRFPQGIAQAGPDWATNVAPYLQTLASLTLPPRRPKGDPANYQRGQAVGEALRRRKVGG